MRVAVDFDETLVSEDENGELHPCPGAAEAMQSLRSKGHRIIVHTCRIGIAMARGRGSQEQAFIISTLDLLGIPFDEVWMGTKLVADCYIDDRAVAYEGNWSATAAAAIDKA